jgi:acyl transferase domain-containing protein/phosphopantetheinyl transferase
VSDEVAIIGMSCVFPGARDVRAYWENIIHKVDAVSDPPPDWESDLFLDPEAETNDRLYCARGGYLGPLAEFNPAEYGIMPNSVDGTEPDHFLALRAAFDAMADAGYLKRAVDRERTEVIIGRGTYVNRGNTTVIQHGIVVDSVLRVLKQLHPEHGDEELAAIKKQLKASLPAFHAETAPGLVPNIISGRIANRLDFMGSNFIVDAACASSLVAVDLGMRDLLSGRCDVAVVGGVHASTPPPIVMIFCQLKAISRRGAIRPFDSRADGTLLGEGVGMVVLKRREDAERDGDRIYAIVKGVGVASDGKALGLLAPRIEGEELALRRAYEAAGVSPSTVGLIEAHGTATAVGDVVEVDALNRVFGSRVGEAPTCALGSVKSMISHLMPASGIAGLIKAVLALHHKVLPPTINCEVPNPKLKLDDSVFYLNTETRPWVHGSTAGPRRAGVNAFGFGGINAHVVLEEYTGAAPAPAPLQHDWDSEVFIVSGDSRAGLIGEGERVLRFLEQEPRASLKDLGYTLNAAAEPKATRLSVVAASYDDLRQKLTRALAKLRDERCQRIREIEGIYYFGAPLGREGSLAFVFPGEGSQYANMLADLSVHFPEVRAVFDFMDRAFYAHPRGYLPSQTIFPPPSPAAAGPAGEGDGRIYRMDSGAEAVFTANQALAALLRALGVQPQAMVGHSTGEHSALLVSGMVKTGSDEELIGHILAVNSVFEQLHTKGDIPHGRLVAVGGIDLATLRAMVGRTDGRVHIAMDNCPHQTVLCGTEESLAEIARELQARRGICQTLPFARAYHTPWFEVFCEPMRAYFKGVRLVPTEATLYSCVTAERYPADAEEVRELVAAQWARTVRFREAIQAMHRDGVRIFVEVGPRANLTGFIDDILRGQRYAAIPSNVQHRSGLAQLNHLVAQLAAHGVPVRLGHLYERRAPRAVDLQATSPASEVGAPATRRVKLETGLRPLRLPEDFSLARPPKPADLSAVPAPVHAASPAPPPVVAAPRRPVAPAAAGPVLARHFQTMEQFLKVQAQVMNGYLAGRAPVAAARPDVPAAALPFVQNVSELVPGQRATMTRRFDLDEDLLFREHTLGRPRSEEDPSLLGLSIVPLTVTMEMLAEAGALLQPGRRLVGMRNLRAYRWITLDEPGPTMEFSARAAAAGEVEVAARERRDDGTIGPVVAEGTMLFADAYPAVPATGPFALADERPSSWRSEQLYREGMFHGPSFQAVKSVERFGADGTVARLEVLPRTGLLRSNPSPVFLTDPVLLDAAGQVLAFWVKERLGILVDVFPYRLEELRIYGPPAAPGTAAECRVRAELVGESQTRCDIDIVDSSGRLLCALKGWEDRRFELPAPFVHLRISPADVSLSTPWDGPLAGVSAVAEVVSCRLETLTEELLEANGGIWLKVLAHLVLGRREREAWQAMSAVSKRRREWLLGRAVAKDAVRELVRRRFGLRLAPADVEVVSDARGRPEVRGAWTARLGVAPAVSISHSNGVAVALAALERDRLIGVDIESVSRRRAGFEKIAFTEQERQIVAALAEDQKLEWYLRLWCAKEAAGKALGRGLADGLLAFEVKAAELDAGDVRLQLGAALQAQVPELGGGEILTYTTREGDFVSSAVVQPRGAERN